MVTVYRSMDDEAEEQCELVVNLLAAEGIDAVLLDDETAGVVEGSFEVRVQPRDVARAEKLIALNPPPEEVHHFDPSSRFDLETVFHAEGSGPMAEVQAMGIKNLLDSAGIRSILVGDSVLPNLPFEVKVARDQADQARRFIAEAESSQAYMDEGEQQAEP